MLHWRHNKWMLFFFQCNRRYYWTKQFDWWHHTFYVYWRQCGCALVWLHLEPWNCIAWIWFLFCDYLPLQVLMLTVLKVTIQSPQAVKLPVCMVANPVVSTWLQQFLCMANEANSCFVWILPGICFCTVSSSNHVTTTCSYLLIIKQSIIVQTN